MKFIELLSPAKDLLTGISAINAGADAVYIGARKFGARSNASNSIQDISKLIDYAHKFNAKIYVTINTLIYDNEIEETRKLIYDIWNIGADAVIIQDMGLLELDLPPIPLFASTQAHNYTVEKTQFLEQVGFKRVILARELSLKEIKNIHENTNIDLEFFIHGALCVSFSGQCYFSHAITGRSGNRGTCSQPCRMTYDLKDNKGKIIMKDKYLLSLKDLNLSNSIPELINAGISSFKIEGRLKDNAYVTNITAYYRKMIDDFFSKDDSYSSQAIGKCTVPFTPNPSKSFNRGFIDYFLHGRKKERFSPDTEKSIGEKIGIVKFISKDHFVIGEKHDLHNSDGICFFNAKKILCGTKINSIKGDKIYPHKMQNICKKTVIYRNNDFLFEKTILNQKCLRQISVSLEVKDTSDGIVLSAVDCYGIKVSKNYPFQKVDSRDKAASLENIKKQLSKSGETIYLVTEINIELSEPWFFKISFLNALRRDILQQLDGARLESYKKESNKIIPNDFPFPEKIVDFRANIANKYARKFYERHGAKITDDAFELQKDNHGKVIMTTKHCIKYEIGLCPKEEITSKNCPSEPWFLENNGKKYFLSFDCKNCVMEIYFD